MKKMLLIICLVFCVFFIKIDVKANCGCVPTSVDTYTLIPNATSYANGEGRKDIDNRYFKEEMSVTIERDSVNSDFIYKLNWGETDEDDNNLGNYSCSLNYSKFSNNFKALVESGRFTDDNGGSLSFYLVFKGCDSELRNNKSDDVYSNEIFYNFTCSCDGVNEDKIDSQEAPIVVDDEGNQVLDDEGNIVKSCKYYSFDDGTVDNMPGEITITISGSDVTIDDKAYSFSGADGNKAKNAFLENGGTCVGVIYLTRDTNKIILSRPSDGSSAEYTYNEKRTASYKQSKDANYTDIWSPDLGKGDCSAVEKIANDVNNYILIPLRYIVPIIFLIMTIIDFAKSVFVSEKSSDGKDISKAKNNLLRRVIISVIVYFIPNIVLMLFNLFGLVCE